MPFVNGKYYMNPLLGRGIEAAREAEIRNLAAKFGSGGIAEKEHGQGDHWVTIDGHHVLIHEGQGHQARPNRRPGNRLARIVFNETSGLRPTNRNLQDLHDARVALSQALRNAEGMRHPPSTVSDILTPSAAQAIVANPAAKAAWEDSQAAVREAAQSTDQTNGATHFFLDYVGVNHPHWATEDRETANYGPFINAAGGGDVPQGARVTIRVYTERPRY